MTADGGDGQFPKRVAAVDEQSAAGNERVAESLEHLVTRARMPTVERTRSRSREGRTERQRVDDRSKTRRQRGGH
jgi:hypothetical protein